MSSRSVASLVSSQEKIVKDVSCRTFSGALDNASYIMKRHAPTRAKSEELRHKDKERRPAAATSFVITINSRRQQTRFDKTQPRILMYPRLGGKASMHAPF